MPSCLGNKEFEVFIGGTRIREMYVGNRQEYQYDSVAPTLDCTNVTGTSSSNPTYYQTDELATINLYGPVFDADSGIAEVRVNNYLATVEGNTWNIDYRFAVNATRELIITAKDNAGNTTTITRYLHVEAYYQYAARIAGAAVQTSLANTLANSTVCTAIAGNSTAYGIMKARYSSTMTSYIDSNYNDGLNKLNYACKLKAFMFHDGYDTGLFSGLTRDTQNSSTITQNNNSVSIATNSYACAYFYWSNKMTLSGYSTLKWVASGNGYVGLSDGASNSTSNVYSTMNKARATFSTGTLAISSYAATAYYYKFGCCNGEAGTFTSLWIE